MADVGSLHGLSRSPDGQTDGRCPWIYLQTWREHCEVLVRALQLGKATFIHSCRTHTHSSQAGRANQAHQRWGWVTHVFRTSWAAMETACFLHFPWGCWEERFYNLCLPTLQASVLLLSAPSQCIPPPGLLRGLQGRPWCPELQGKKGPVRGLET